MNGEEWMKSMLDEERKQTRELGDIGWLILAIAFVVVGGAVLSIVLAFLSFGAAYSSFGR